MSSNVVTPSSTAESASVSSNSGSPAGPPNSNSNRSFFQTNSEAEFCGYLHRLSEGADGALINAGAWTHYSRAIADAFAVDPVPAIEVHLSDVDNREDWRKVSVFDGLVADKVSGKGIDGYKEALEMMPKLLGIAGD